MKKPIMPDSVLKVHMVGYVNSFFFWGFIFCTDMITGVCGKPWKNVHTKGPVKFLGDDSQHSSMVVILLIDLVPFLTFANTQIPWL